MAETTSQVVHDSRPPGKHCNGLKRDGSGHCARPAGWGTDHAGAGRCKLHGGSNPVKHGRYSSIKTRRLGDKIAEFEADPDPLNLEPEAAAIRALVAGFLERFDELEDALLAWNRAEYEEAAEEKRKPRPVRVPQIHDAAGLLVDVSKVVEKIHRQRATSAVNLAQVSEWFKAFGAVVAKHVTDPDTLAAIERDWGSVLPRP